MNITIDGRTFGKVTELNVKRAARRTEERYNTNGDLLIDLVNRKYELEAVFGLLTSGELGELRALTEKIFVTVKFEAPEGEVEEQFYIAEEPAPTLTVINGVTMYGGVRLNMKQK